MFCMCRLSIMNLNKQVRLYQQGLTPFMRSIPGKGSWERLRDRSQWEVRISSCYQMLLQKKLNIADVLIDASTSITYMCVSMYVFIYIRVGIVQLWLYSGIIIDLQMTEQGMKLDFQFFAPDQRKQTTYFAFCYPHSYADCQRRLSRLDQRFLDPSSCDKSCDRSHDQSIEKNDIYYHRELLTQSLKGLRVDLITVSSYEGILDEKEQRLPNMFPDYKIERSRKFVGKRVS